MAPYVERNGRALELPVTEELARTNLALPISPVFSSSQAEAVVAALARS
jgi:dTDP-4-amino-4,6-dideoxygalactose transaminase